MNDSFLSLVVELNSRHSSADVKQFLENFEAALASKLDDFEIVLVYNGAKIDLSEIQLNERIRRNCFILKLARPVSWDTAIFAGFEQANGDYAVGFDLALGDHIDIIRQMIERAVEGADMVYLRDAKSTRSGPSIRRRAFFAAMKLSGEKHLHYLDRQEFLLSRRALNWVVRDQTQTVYMNDAIRSLGFETSRIDVTLPRDVARRTYSEAASQAWSTLARSPRFLSGIAQLVVLVFLMTFMLTSLDALLVRFFQINILGQPDTIVPGWTFLVLITSIGFMLCSFLLYIILRLNMLLLAELRRQQKYTIEKFERI